MRFGGSGADVLEYGLGDAPPCEAAFRNNDTQGCLNETHWSALHTLSSRAPNLLFGASFDLPTACFGPIARRGAFVWNASGVRGRGTLALLKHAIKLRQPIWGLELGNEINNANRKCPIVFGCECGLRPQQQADAVLALSSALDTLPWSAATPRPVQVGPDTGGFRCAGSSCPWADGVLSALQRATPRRVLHAVTHHVYAGISPADYQEPAMYDRYKTDAAWYLPLVAAKGAGAQPWAGENGPIGGGEDGSCGAKEREATVCGTFASALWYADALAARAAAGFAQFQRQDLLGGMYGLLGIPKGGEWLGAHDAVILRADFWIAYLWKRLVGRTVLRASLGSTYNGTLRAYAHQGPPPSAFSPPAASACKEGARCYTAIVINLGNATRAVGFGPSCAAHATYALAPPATGGPLSLGAPILNGQPLQAAIHAGTPIGPIPVPPASPQDGPVEVAATAVLFALVRCA